MAHVVSILRNNAPVATLMRKLHGAKSGHVPKAAVFTPVLSAIGDVTDCRIFSNPIGNVLGLLFGSDRPACINYIRERGEQAFADEMTLRKCHAIKKQ